MNVYALPLFFLREQLIRTNISLPTKYIRRSLKLCTILFARVCRELEELEASSNSLTAKKLTMFLTANIRVNIRHPGRNILEYSEYY